jgi:hypothetical protein
MRRPVVQRLAIAVAVLGGAAAYAVYSAKGLAAGKSDLVAWFRIVAVMGVAIGTAVGVVSNRVWAGVLVAICAIVVALSVTWFLIALSIGNARIG